MRSKPLVKIKRLIVLARRYWSLPRLERLGLPVAFGFLGVAYIAIHTMHFKRLVRSLGEAHGTAPLIPLVNPSQWQRAKRVGWVVQTAARHTPWPSNCFAQALTSAWLLKRLKVAFGVYFGLAKQADEHNADDARLDAHAWVASGPCWVVGRYSFDRFTVVGCWIWKPNSH